MSYWVTPSEMADYDRQTIARGTPGDQLMERAGGFAAGTAMRMVSRDDGRVEIWAGPGNNGGDGFVLARHMAAAGYDVVVILAATDYEKLSKDCLRNLTRFRDAGGTILGMNRLEDLEDSSPALAVDALLGTGFRGKLRGSIAGCVTILRQRNCPVLALDTPTGVDGSTGESDDMAPAADVTVCFAAPKKGLLVPPGCGLAGAVFVAPIGVSIPGTQDRVVLDLPAARALLPGVPADAHKGTNGRLLLLGGAESMPGAPQLMALGALRSGVGLAHICVPYPAAPAVSGRIPEALCSYFLPGDVTSLPDPEGFQAAAAGPGMGDDAATEKVVSYIVRNWNVPLVLDADGLNVLGDHLDSLAEYPAPIVLTPHPGELRRLTTVDDAKGTPEERLEKRWDAAGMLARLSGATVLVKGRPTMVTGPRGQRRLVASGGKALATGGSGDVLTGIIGSLLAQGLDPEDAAAAGAYIHGLSGEILAAESSFRSVLPSEVAANLGRALCLVESNTPDTLLRLEGRWNGRLWNIP
jgi:NAD(P)H-hydrate epimerase